MIEARARPERARPSGGARLRIALLSLGSRGDVEPYVGLGSVLARRGHVVTVAAPTAFAGLVRRAGLRWHPVPPDPRLLADGGGPPEWLERSATHGAARLRRAAASGRSLHLAYSRYLAAGEAADVVLHPPWLTPVARTIEESTGCRTVPAYLAPLHPTRAFPSPFFNPGLPERMNYASHRIALWLGRAALNGAPNTWRARVTGLAPARLDLLPPEGELCLYGYSPTLLPPPKDWPPGPIVTGTWWSSLPEDWRPPRDLERFLRLPGKVVFVGFGSMMDPRPSELNRIVEDALAGLGLRAVVLKGPTGTLDLPPSSQLLAVRDVPLSWLFRRVEAIVHHGGVGTTAEAIRAGKPSIVVPIFGDQSFWGERLHRTGGGPRPIPRRSLGRASLQSALEEAIEDPSLRDRAARLGERIRVESGAETAASLVEAAALPGPNRGATRG